MPAAIIAVLAVLLRVLVVRVIFALGLTFVSFVGYNKALDYLKDITVDSFNSLPSELYNLLMIAGVGTGLGYIFGAFSFLISFKVLNKISFGFGK